MSITLSKLKPSRTYKTAGAALQAAERLFREIDARDMFKVLIVADDSHRFYIVLYNITPDGMQAAISSGCVILN